MEENQQLKTLAQQLQSSPFFPLLERLRNTLEAKWNKEKLVKENEFDTLVATIRREERLKALEIFFQELEQMTY